mmetsp:Transcript_12216/g.20703  ORF Transcript_12216/g.20703 Transcript_12216/m.20703 type:complete len:223 (+) Transcript_12216:1159-1827(+)
MGALLIARLEVEGISIRSEHVVAQSRFVCLVVCSIIRSNNPDSNDSFGPGGGKMTTQVGRRVIFLEEVTLLILLGFLGLQRAAAKVNFAVSVPERLRRENDFSTRLDACGITRALFNLVDQAMSILNIDGTFGLVGAIAAAVSSALAIALTLKVTITTRGSHTVFILYISNEECEHIFFLKGTVVLLVGRGGNVVSTTKVLVLLDAGRGGGRGRGGQRLRCH